MSAETLLARLRAAGARLLAVDGKLRVTAPPGVITDQVRESLRTHKQTLLELLGPAGTHGPRPRWAGEDTPLSPFQERMWYFARTGWGSAYNVPTALRLSGPLRERALRESLARLVARHPVLRASFVEEEGVPIQRYAETIDVALPLEDLSGLPEGGRREECHRRMQRLCHHDFDVARPPLHLFRLYRIDEEEHVLFSLIHHSLVDAWSLDVVIRELGADYSVLAVERQPDHGAVSVQFPDWVLWQQTHPTADDVAADLDFWCEKLAGPLPSLELVPDRPRPAEYSLDGADFPFELEATLVRRIQEVGRSDGATPYMVVQTALKAAVHLLSGATDLIVGTPVAGRARDDQRDLVGPLVNTLAIRSHLDPSGTLRDFARTVRGDVLQALAHQGVPFDVVVRSLGLPRDASRAPVYQMSLDLWDASEPVPRWGDLDVALQRVSTPWSHAEFSMWLTRGDDDALRGWCTYSTALFDEATARRLAQATRTVLEQYATDPDTYLAAIDLVTEDERTCLAAWNDTIADRSADIPVHEQVFRQAGASPDRTAVRCGEEELTYAQVEVGSRKMAAALAAEGVGPGDLIGVLMGRQAHLLPVLLGILRSGAGYVPIDPAYPPQRVAYILRDSGVSLVVGPHTPTDQHDGGPSRIDPNDVWSAPEPEAVPAPRVGEDETAYVIYTSGSSGRPKGVAVTHGNVANFLEAMRERPGLEAQDRLLAVTTISFDIAVLELFLPLVCGGCVVIATEDESQDGRTVGELLVAGGISVLQATPSFWRLLLDSGWQGSPSLKALCGGEALGVDLARELLGRVGELWNMYGPTETTVWSAVHRVEAGDPSRSSIPIGRPIRNTTVHVLDERLRPVPVGTPGELYIGGAGVTRGYLGRPKLTDGAFVTLPGTGSIYRTGDIARFRHDGNLECMGRVDAQIKVRGHRIEPGEIETALRMLEPVRDTVVAARSVADGDVRLVAYVTLDPPGALMASEVRAHLRRSLPEPMIPGLVVEMEAIPRTPNGKVDRNALPDPFGTASRPVSSLSPPDSEEERLVAEVWKGLLQTDEVGLDDNFFDLGGHSLLSIRAVAQLERDTGVRIDPRRFFFHSLRQIAASLRTPPGDAPGTSG